MPREGDNIRYSQCKHQNTRGGRHPGPEGSPCHWIDHDGADSFKEDHVYYMMVETTNLLGNDSSVVVKVVTADIVEPSPMTNLHAPAIGLDSMVLAWTSPVHIKKKPMLYQVLYKPDWSTTWLKINVTGEDVPVNLTQLVPYSTYTVSVTGIPLIDGEVQGFWSNSSNTSVANFTTLEDVPGANPTVLPSSFQTLPGADPTRRRVKVYWQNVPRSLQHGQIVSMEVQYRPIEAGSRVRRSAERTAGRTTVIVRNGHPDYANFTLARDTSYEVSVLAVSRKGINVDLVPHPVFVAAEAILPRVKGFVAQGNDSGVYLSWHADPSATNYTVFWCKGSVHDYNCLDGLKWTQTNTTLHYIPLLGQRYQDLIVAVSMETSGHLDGSGPLNSGIVWSECIHNMNADMQPPLALTLSKHQPSDSIQLEWEKPPCEAAYIAYYILAYCELRHCINQDSYQTVKVSNAEMSFTLHGLRPDVKYRLRIRSVGEDSHMSPYSDSVEQTVAFSGLRGGQLVGIIIGSLIVVALVLLGLWSVARYCKKYSKKYTHVEIRRPDALSNTVSMMNGGADQYINTQDAYGCPDASATSRMRENLTNYEREKSNGVQSSRASNGLSSNNTAVTYKNLMSTADTMGDSGCSTLSANTSGVATIPEMSAAEEADNDVFLHVAPETAPGYDTPRSQRLVDPERTLLLDEKTRLEVVSSDSGMETAGLLQCGGRNDETTAMPDVSLTVPPVRSPKLSNVSEYSALSDIPSMEPPSPGNSSITPYSRIEEGQNSGLQTVSEGSMSSSLPSLIEVVDNKNNGNNNALVEPLHSSDPKIHQPFEAADLVPTRDASGPSTSAEEYQDFDTVLQDSAPQSPSPPWETQPPVAQLWQSQTLPDSKDAPSSPMSDYQDFDAVVQNSAPQSPASPPPWDSVDPVYPGPTGGPPMRGGGKSLALPTMGNALSSPTTDYQDINAVLQNSAPQSPVSPPPPWEIQPPVSPGGDNCFPASPPWDEVSAPHASPPKNHQDPPRTNATPHSRLPQNSSPQSPVSPPWDLNTDYVASPASPDPVPLGTGYVFVPGANTPVSEPPWSGPTPLAVAQLSAADEDCRTSRDSDTDINSNKTQGSECFTGPTLQCGLVPESGYVAHAMVH